MECCDETFIVHRNVFPPRSDTELLVSSMCIRKRSAVMDVGTGCGVLAIFAALRGASHVVAVDMNDDAVTNARINITAFGLDSVVEAKVSDVFLTIDTRRYDTIIANLPGRNQTATNMVEAAQWDTEFGAHKKLFSGAKKYLKPNGNIIMVKANYPELNDLIDLASKNGFVLEVLGCKKPSGEEFRTYYALSFLLQH